MPTAAPFVKLLRQLAAAKDDYRTGALDIEWDGGRATIFLVFGQPNHAAFEADSGERLAGTEALAALVRHLPPKFNLSPWRKEVVRSETLSCTLEELMEPFAQMAGAASPGPPTAPNEGGAAAPDGLDTQPDFGLQDFPLLPLGPSLWADAAASVVHLDVLIPSLPDALIVLTGPKLRAAAVVVSHHLVDAVWVEEEERMLGEAAAMALMGARQGSISGYRLETPRLAESVTLLWRCPAVYREMPAAWVNAQKLLADLEERRRDSALVVTGAVHGVALVSGGSLVGVYTERERLPEASPERLAELLSSPGARLTLRQRPEDRPADHLPEAAYHAFVERPAQGPTALADAFATISATDHPPADSLRMAADGPVAAAGLDAESPAAAETPPPPPPSWLTSEADDAGPPLPPEAPSLPASPDPPASPPPPPPQEEARAAALAAWAPSAPPISLAAAPTSAPALAAALVTEADEEPAPPESEADFEAMKADLIQIGSLWLGTEGVAPVAEMIRRTRPTIDDIMATIEAIRQASLPGNEPSVVQAMTREMRYHAAEYLSGL